MFEIAACLVYKVYIEDKFCNVETTLKNGGKNNTKYQYVIGLNCIITILVSQMAKWYQLWCSY